MNIIRVKLHIPAPSVGSGTTVRRHETVCHVDSPVDNGNTGNVNSPVSYLTGGCKTHTQELFLEHLHHASGRSNSGGSNVLTYVAYPTAEFRI